MQDDFDGLQLQKTEIAPEKDTQAEQLRLALEQIHKMTATHQDQVWKLQTEATSNETECASSLRQSNDALSEENASLSNKLEFAANEALSQTRS